jgi:hypothetical protein
VEESSWHSQAWHFCCDEFEGHVERVKEVPPRCRRSKQDMFPRRFGYLSSTLVTLLWSFSVSEIGEGGADGACRCRTMVDVIVFAVELS